MPQSAYASPTPSRPVALLRHPATASLAVVLVALTWASVGFASSLFTNDIVVSDQASGLIRSSVSGPFALLLLCCGAWIGSLWRPAR